MSRDDLVRTNADIVKQVSQEIKRHCPNAIVVVVSNPLDVMCWVTKQVTGFPRERVIGMAGGLDTARLRGVVGGSRRLSVRGTRMVGGGGPRATTRRPWARAPGPRAPRRPPCEPRPP